MVTRSDSWTIVVNGAGRKGSRERFERFLHLAFAPAPPRLLNPTRLRGRDVYQLKARVGANGGAVPQPLEPVPLGPAGLADPVAPAPQPEPPAPEVPWLSWWFEKDDLVLISVPLAHVQSDAGPGDGETDCPRSTRPSSGPSSTPSKVSCRTSRLTPATSPRPPRERTSRASSPTGCSSSRRGRRVGSSDCLQQRSAVSQLELPGLPSLPHGSGLPQQFAGGYATPAIPTPDGADSHGSGNSAPGIRVAPSTGAATGHGRRDSPGVAS